MEHQWPPNDEDHVWGPWMTRSRTEQWRGCVHPLCDAFETREAP